ncbi:MAG TPA: hypothetical protein VKV77_07910 [Methylovirgula sp.]|nr:hypothetical protein [Methylovirgula sp.]
MRQPELYGFLAGWKFRYGLHATSEIRRLAAGAHSCPLVGWEQQRWVSAFPG